MKKPKAIVLGGTIPHISLIENLKERGYYTILIDYFENPPAKKYADKHIKESTLNKEQVLEIAKGQSVDLVITACVDHANVTSCYVAEKLNLPQPYSYDTALSVTNKVLMKRKMVENGIPTSDHIVLNDPSEIKNSVLNMPLIIKPADSNTSKGVRKVNHLKELNKYINEAFKISRIGKTILEEFKEGIELSAYAFIQDKKTKFLMLSQRFSSIDNNKESIKCFATLTPPNISKKAKEKIQSISDKIATAFNLDNTPLHFEVIVKKDDVNVIELTPRIGGGLSFRTIKLSTGFDIINSTVDSFLGIEKQINYNTNNNLFAINIIYSKPGIFSYIHGSEELIKEKIVEELYTYKTTGMKIETDIPSKSRVGAFIIRGKNLQEIFEKTKIAITKLEVYDINNNPLMKKDLYLNEKSYNTISRQNK